MLKSFTHKVEILLDVAGLKGDRDAQANSQPAFANSWHRIRDWDESSRYQRWTEARARELFAAVTEATDGVLPWITARW